MNKFQVIIEPLNDKGENVASITVEALGFKSAYTAAMRAWGGKSSDVCAVKITRVPS